MNFSFEFDAPKHTDFGRMQERRRTTQTSIDGQSIYDRWFTKFRKIDYHNFYLEKKEEKKIVQNEQEVNFQKKKQNKKEQDQKQNQVIRRNQIMKLDRKQTKNVKNIQKVKRDNQELKKNNNQTQNSISHTNKILKPIKPAQSLNIQRKVPPKQQIIKAKVQNKNNPPAPATQILRKNLKTSNTTSLLQNKKTKSQSSLSIDTANLKKTTSTSTHRNPPCLFPMRIQRQWQQQNNKKWYQLEPHQIKVAQQMMRQMMNKQKAREESNQVSKNIGQKKNVGLRPYEMKNVKKTKWKGNKDTKKQEKKQEEKQVIID